MSLWPGRHQLKIEMTVHALNTTIVCHNPVFGPFWFPNSRHAYSEGEGKLSVAVVGQLLYQNKIKALQAHSGFLCGG